MDRAGLLYRGGPKGHPVEDAVRPFLALTFAAVLAGCDACTGAIHVASDAGTADAGDAGTTADGGLADAGIRDGGPVDAGARDGGPADAGDGGAAPCGTITTFADGLSPSREVHVATTGNDTTGDGSPSRPYATIARGARAATAGAAVRVHAGTYAGGGFVDSVAGRVDAPIWIGGAPGEARPLISDGTEGLHLSRVRYLVVHDLEVGGATGNGINCDDGGDYANADATRHLVFRRLFIHDIGSGGNQDCLKLSGVNDYVVLDSEFAPRGAGAGGSAIDHVGCHRGLIARNNFHDCGANAVQTKGGSEDIEIRWNRFVDAGSRAANMGGSTGLTLFRPPLSTSSPNAEARNVRAVANLFVRSEAPLAFVGCVDCLAANNTIIDPTRWLLRILQETTSGSGYTFLPASNGRLVNNLFYFNRSALSEYVNIGPNTQPSSFVFSNNLWYAHDNPAQSTPTLPSAETGGVTGQNPAFIGPSGDYGIGTTSPAAGRGVAVAGASGDITGRCWASPPSIGAWEAR